MKYYVRHNRCRASQKILEENRRIHMNLAKTIKMETALLGSGRTDIRRDGLSKSKGSVQHDVLSWRHDLANLNPKYHMN